MKAAAVKALEEEESRAKEAAADELRRLQEQAELDFSMEDEDDLDYDVELDDEDWEASVRLANELQGIQSPLAEYFAGENVFENSDDLLPLEFDNLSKEEEDALGRAAREAVRKYEEEMRAKQSEKKNARTSWDNEMVIATPPQPSPKRDGAINGVEKVDMMDRSGPAGIDADYSKMTVTQLKDLLRSKGLKLSGKKEELIERLERS